MATSPLPPAPADPLRERAARMKLFGLLAHWEEHASAPWLATILEQEEVERGKRSLERRVRDARVGRFKPIADFDWTWPTEVDRELVEELFTLEFLKTPANVVLVGPSGIGKSMIAQNLVYQAVLRGCSARFISASDLLNDLVAQESAAALGRRLRRYVHPNLLAIDEVGYLSYDARHADLLFQVVSRRAEQRSTIITTNRVFRDWSEVFPNASCVVALVDRLVQRAEIVKLDGESYRLKEAKEREAKRAAERAARASAKTSKKR